MPDEQDHPVLRSLRKLTAADGAGDATDAQLLDRFVARRDEAAFAALVRRHGPMILGVCRRVLRDAHAAEDASQATFLVLARKARSLGRPESLGNWLYGVAYRTALKARAGAARRREQEGNTLAPAGADPAEEAAGREAGRVLDEELNRLPSKYRDPLVLCHLEGQTHEEAARALGCPRKTVTTRLARARERLRARLLRRGVDLSAGAAAALLSEGAAPAVALPAVDAIVRAAVGFATGKAADGAVSAPVAALAKRVLTSMFVTKLKAAALVLALIAAVGVGVWVYQAPAGERNAAGGKDGPNRAAGGVGKARGDDQKTDKEALQGIWVPVAAERNGWAVTDQQIRDKNFETVFSGDKVTVPIKGGPKMGTYTLDPSREPKQIDFLLFKDKPRKGIYLLEGDALTVCVAESEDGERPAAFESKKGSNVLLMKLKRK